MSHTGYRSSTGRSYKRYAKFVSLVNFIKSLIDSRMTGEVKINLHKGNISHKVYVSKSEDLPM